MRKKIAIIDDDKKIRDLIKQYLNDQGFECFTGEHGKDLDQVIQKKAIDLIILDLMLPNESGLDICKRIRVNKVNIPIIMLTAKGDEVDRIIGLEMGADDYLPKPFNPRELLARINSIFRRLEMEMNENVIKRSTNLIKFDGFEFNAQERTLKKGQQSIDLTSGEFTLLKVFIENVNQPLSRDQIMQLARGKELDVFDRSIDVQISRIRKLIEDNPNKPKYLKTKWGYGYVFEMTPQS
ncbi:MAG: response regulator [Proteobacteria bacterium]|jgi:two-component system, OmpR family, phosphate regulon response regulator OmpR|nr:response regulator [Pseudomonadota bacterium]MDA0941431.1 response regulator [Pseudomonadota bacterium]MDA1034018.1 response regulator [Pseudomonadota bacterium]